MAMKRDPIDMMLKIATRFEDQADELDLRAQEAADDDANQTTIFSLLDAAATYRMRCLHACQAVAPFVRPRLQAIEPAPAELSTVERFRQRVAHLTEDQVVERLKAVAAGASAITLLEDGESEGA